MILSLIIVNSNRFVDSHFLATTFLASNTGEQP
jgi:hypothetical protein